MIDNDLNGKCLQERNSSLHENFNKIDRYLKHVPSINYAKVSL